PGQGWQRVDPTAMVAPDRVERARQVFRHGNPFPGPLSNIDPAVWGRVRSYIDAGNHRWNVWVLQYSRARQMDMLKNWGFASPDWVDLLRLAGGMLLVISVLGMAWLWWMRPRTQATPWQRPMQRVHQALQASRSEERRVGKEGGCRWARARDKEKRSSTEGTED